MIFMKKQLFIIICLIVSVSNAASVTNVLVRQQWPWDNAVNIDYHLVGTEGALFDVMVRIKKDGNLVEVNPASFSGDLYSVAGGEKRIVWDPKIAFPDESGIGECSFELTVKPASVYKYLVVDISKGCSNGAKYPTYFLQEKPEGGWSDEFKTSKLVLRRCEPGTFVMGSPDDELYREGSGSGSEKQSEVTFTNHFYIGVFELTVKQYELIAGTNITYVADSGEIIVDNANAMVPATGLRYKDLRGDVDGIAWPSKIGVDEGSFMSLIRKRTYLPKSVPKGWVFDLPTEAQWEYACRAGSTEPHYDGTYPMPSSNDSSATDSTLNALGWYRGNSGYARHVVGLKKENSWGLFDMYGNASEYVIEGTDGSGAMPSGIEPKNGKMTRNNGNARRVRGGSYCASFMHCRSASRRELWDMNDPVEKLRYNIGNGWAMGARVCLHYVE